MCPFVEKKEKSIVFDLTYKYLRKSLIAILMDGRVLIYSVNRSSIFLKRYS